MISKTKDRKLRFAQWHSENLTSFSVNTKFKANNQTISFSILRDISFRKEEKLKTI